MSIPKAVVLRVTGDRLFGDLEVSGFATWTTAMKCAEPMARAIEDTYKDQNTSVTIYRKGEEPVV